MSKGDKKLSKSLRARGVRRKLADKMTRAATGAAGPKVARRAIADLESVITEVHDRLQGRERSAAGKKAARTRKRNAERRSQAAKRGARKRRP